MNHRAYQCRLTAERLAIALRSMVTDATMIEKARVIGVKLRAEDGVTEAVQRLTSMGAALGIS